MAVVVPPDGGWGWVVMVAAFFNSVLVSGILKSAGVLYMAIMDAMDVSRTEAALVPSVMFGITSFFAPVATSLSARFTPRVVVFCGALVAATGLAIASLSLASITFTTVVYGLIVGCGCGLIFVPNIVVVYSYFERRRAFASSFAIAGGSIGLFVIPPLVEYVAEEHGLRAVFLTLSAVILQVCPAALLFRPLRNRKKKLTVPIEEKIPVEIDKDSHNVNVVADAKPENEPNKVDSVLFFGENDEEASLRDHNVNLESRYTLLCPLTMPVNNLFQGRKLVDIAKESQLSNSHQQNDESEDIVDPQKAVKYSLLRKGSKDEVEFNELNKGAVNNNDAACNKIITSSEQEQNVLFLDPEKVKSNESIQRCRESINDADRPNSKNLCHRILQSIHFDVSVFREKYFVMLMLTMFSFAFTWSGYLTLLPDYAYHESADKVTKTEAALLLSAMSAGDAIFRIVYGWISDRGWMKLQHYFIISMFLTGIVLACYSLSLTYTMFIVISVVYGAVVSAVIVLPPLLLNEFLGAQRFPMAYAICGCASGIAVFCSPPILAYVREVYGSYKPCFLIMGLMLILWAVVWFLDEVGNQIRTQAKKDLEAEHKKRQSSSC